MYSLEDTINKKNTSVIGIQRCPGRKAGPKLCKECEA
jgi:hypothetical protein